MSDLTRLTIAEARDALAKGDTSSVALTDAYLDAIEAANGEMNAYVYITGDKARTMAKASDARRASGKVGALPGATIRRPARTFWTASSRSMNQPSPPISGPMAPFSLASSTWMSSPWAHPMKVHTTAQ